jgi:hypothetical protein
LICAPYGIEGVGLIDICTIYGIECEGLIDISIEGGDSLLFGGILFGPAGK